MNAQCKCPIFGSPLKAFIKIKKSQTVRPPSPNLNQQYFIAPFPVDHNQHYAPQPQYFQTPGRYQQQPQFGYQAQPSPQPPLPNLVTAQPPIPSPQPPTPNLPPA